MDPKRKKKTMFIYDEKKYAQKTLVTVCEILCVKSVLLAV